MFGLDWSKTDSKECNSLVTNIYYFKGKNIVYFTDLL